MRPRYQRFEKPKFCYVCKENLPGIDFIDVNFLQKYIDQFGRISSSQRTGFCAKHQRELSKAIKRAREAGLISYV